jgi:hypothetical protein
MLCRRACRRLFGSVSCSCEFRPYGGAAQSGPQLRNSLRSLLRRHFSRFRLVATPRAKRVERQCGVIFDRCRVVYRAFHSSDFQRTLTFDECLDCRSRSPHRPDWKMAEVMALATGLGPLRKPAAVQSRGYVQFPEVGTSSGRSQMRKSADKSLSD